MTPVVRGILAFVLIAGAGPAGFLIYHAVFNSHPLPGHPGAAHPSSAPSSAPGSAPSPVPLSAPQLPSGPTQTTSSRGTAPLVVPQSIALPDRNGSVHLLGEFRGHPLVLNFWATWCEPCRREIPLLQALHQEHGAAVQVVGVALDFQKDALPYAQSRGITYPLLMGEKDGLAAVNALGMDTSLPFTIFADSRGNIVAVKVGELHADEARLILADVTAVDAGRLALGEARDAVSAGLRSLAIARAQQGAGSSAPAG